MFRLTFAPSFTLRFIICTSRMKLFLVTTYEIDKILGRHQGDVVSNGSGVVVRVQIYFGNCQDLPEVIFLISFGSILQQMPFNKIIYQCYHLRSIVRFR